MSEELNKESNQKYGIQILKKKHLTYFCFGILALVAAFFVQKAVFIPQNEAPSLSTSEIGLGLPITLNNSQIFEGTYSESLGSSPHGDQEDFYEVFKTSELSTTVSEEIQEKHYYGKLGTLLNGNRAIFSPEKFPNLVVPLPESFVSGFSELFDRETKRSQIKKQNSANVRRFLCQLLGVERFEDYLISDVIIFFNDQGDYPVLELKEPGRHY